MNPQNTVKKKSGGQWMRLNSKEHYDPQNLSDIIRLMDTKIISRWDDEGSRNILINLKCWVGFEEVAIS